MVDEDPKAPVPARSRTAVILAAGMLLFGGLVLTGADPSAPGAAGAVSGINNIGEFLEKCPTNDPMYDQIRSDFEIRREGAPVGSIACWEPVSAMPIAQYTDELIIVQALRAVYYMDGGRSTPYPWTSGSTLYDWLKMKIGGIDIRANNPHCCEAYNGSWYVVLDSQGDFARTTARGWPGMSARISLIGHETRHVEGFPHVGGCPLFPNLTFGCDQTYDESNLSPYGIQWWLNAKWLSGEINVGFGCLPPNIATEIANGHLFADNNDFGRRFVDASPPVLTMPEQPGGPCPGSVSPTATTNTPPPSVTATPTPSATPTSTPAPTHTPTPTAIATATPGQTPTPKPSPTVTPSPFVRPSPWPSPAPSPTPGPRDTDLDGYSDVLELACGSVHLFPGSVPERTDGTFAGVSDDGDWLIDEPLPPEAVGHDCDRDGWPGVDEDQIFSAAAGDQDPCGTTGWPAELYEGGPSDNRVDLLDATAYLAPVRRLGTSPGDTGFSARFDLEPGPGALSKQINVQDMTRLVTFVPPMLGARAYEGGACPYAP